MRSYLASDLSMSATKTLNALPDMYFGVNNGPCAESPVSGLTSA
jgi:hypothetical protein